MKLVSLEALIAQMEEEFVGVWKFRTRDEGPGNRRWCATVLVAGRLIDTEDQPTIELALQVALNLVEEFRL